MKDVHGWAFPDVDEFMAGQLHADGTYQGTHLTEALTHVRVFGTAIDGGAHVGTWSVIMAQHFHHVVAFEPAPDTHACLIHNLATRGITNVVCHQIALGETSGTVSMHVDAANAERKNTGGRFAKAGGDIPMRTLDSYALEDVGFLKLDVEGSELVALRGAKATLKRWRPLVLFENKKLWKRNYGMRSDVVEVFLKDQGYALVAPVGCDHIWAPR